MSQGQGKMRNSFARSRCIPCLIGILVFGFLPIFSSIAIPSAGPSDDTSDLSAILDAVARKVRTYSNFENWETMVVSIRTRMNRHWQPVKTTRIIKHLRISGESTLENILEAWETEDGVTQDITAEVRRKSSKKPQDRKGRIREIAKEDLVPFDGEHRGAYTFRRQADTQMDGIPALVIETRALSADSDLWEGTYIIAKDTFDILKITLKPSRRPIFVRNMEAEMEFRPGSEGIIPKILRFKVHAGFLIKSIRMTVVEEYRDFRFL